MKTIEEKIIEAGFVLPEPTTASTLYVPAIRVGELVYTSGQLPLVNGKLVEPGGSGVVSDANKDEAVYASKIALINALAAIKSVTGSLEVIQKIIKLVVYVTSNNDFSSQHLIANGASSLLYELFNNNGVHIRSAIGVYKLPLNSSLELELIAQVK